MDAGISMEGWTVTLKERFLTAVRQGDIGESTELGAIVTVGEFKAYFKDINEGYAETFLPSAVIEAGQYSVSQTRFVFRVKNGVYRVHPQALTRGTSKSRLKEVNKTALHWCSMPKF